MVFRVKVGVKAVEEYGRSLSSVALGRDAALTSDLSEPCGASRTPVRGGGRGFEGLSSVHAHRIGAHCVHGRIQQGWLESDVGAAA